MGESLRLGAFKNDIMHSVQVKRVKISNKPQLLLLYFVAKKLKEIIDCIICIN